MNHKIGILGAGRIAHKMAYTVSQMDGYEICAVASRSMDNAHNFANQYGIRKRYDSYEALVTDPEIELVYIATPHSLHYSHAMLCLRNRKPVLCEKSFTTTAKEAEELFSTAKEYGVFITEAIWTRYMPLSQKITELANSGIIGTPRTLSANLCYPVADKERLIRADLGGGALLDIGTYPLHFAAMVFGTDIEHTVSSCILTDTGVDAQECISQYFSNNRTAVLYSSIYARSDRKGIISGDKGYIVVENINNPQVARIYDGFDNLISEHYAPQQITGFEYQVQACFDALAVGAIETPFIPHEETIRIMKIMDSLRKEWGVSFPADNQ